MKLHHPEAYALRYADAIRRADRAYSTPAYLGDTLIQELVKLTPLGIYLRPALAQLARESDNPESFLLLRKSDMLNDIYASIVERIEHIAKNAYVQEEVMTAIKYTHSSVVWELRGKHIYEVHPDLSWALQNTDLKDFVTEDLRLPHKAIYLELPRELQIPNRLTGNHPCVGVYVMEELLDDTRIWRIVLIGEGNDSPESNAYKEQFGYDDAIFHYWLELNKPTIDECIEDQLQRSRHNKRVTYHWKGEPLQSMSYMLFDSEVDFADYSQVMTETFRYIMNCMIYATTAESDVWFYEASKEYRDLKDRAMKAQGLKRKRLFKELKEIPSRGRTVLGSRTLIDRKRAKDDNTEKVGGTLTKRTLVAGHWQRYWVGEGRKQCVRKLRLPFWRGPGEEVVVADVGQRVTRLR
jgi:hypothetical protein